ncbi:MAG: YfiR family protein [Candidatus Methylopumilus sp.]|jgi:hypothetical protein
MMLRHFIKLLLSLLLFGVATTVHAEAVPETEMRAAYLYNFALFTDWPNPTGDTIRLCILKADQTDFATEKIENKLINGKLLTITTISSSNAAKGCQMLYISSYQSSSVRKIVAELEDTPVLTVTDTENGAAQGMMIEMLLDNNRLGFKVNNKAVRRANLTLSAKLLRLAKTIY